MSLQRKFSMKSNSHGLTVGELTMTVGVLIIASLIWTTLIKKQDSQKNNLNSYNSIEFLHDVSSPKMTSLTSLKSEIKSIT